MRKYISNKTLAKIFNYNLKELRVLISLIIMQQDEIVKWRNKFEDDFNGTAKPPDEV